jgi:N-acetylglucosaminyldiphosphoundecaprenol N-acetyl-beta-D-mannosaminyltransferase
MRVADVDLFERFLGMAKKRKLPVYMLGATDDVVTRVVAELRVRFLDLQIAGYNNGYFWNDEASVVRRSRESGARLLFVAITSPKKEQFINDWRLELGVDFVMGIGGAFDVVAGKIRRAPKWMRSCG